MLLQRDGIAFELLEEQDFSWLSAYGRVFRVFDRQDSGNLCFGVEGKYGRLFVKYAGARTVNSNYTPRDAIAALRAAAPLYDALAHPVLIKLLAHGPVGDGYAAVFEWFTGESLHAHWQFDEIPKYTDPRSPNVRLLRLPLTTQLRLIDRVFDFFVCMAQKGYVAVDFYDGSLMVDFDALDIRICDIDYFRPAPLVNDRGRMPGSSRFLSPEEYELGASLDEITNVYALGALAFEWFGKNPSRLREDWRAPMPLFEVAQKATSAERSQRYPSLAAFLEAWRGAMGRVGAFTHDPGLLRRPAPADAPPHRTSRSPRTRR